MLFKLFNVEPPKTMGQWALFIGIFMIVFIIMFAKPKQRKVYKTRDDRIVNLYNNYLLELKEVESAFMHKVNNIDRKIVYAHDVYAKIQLTYIVDEYKALLNDIYDKLSTAKSYIIKDNNKKGAEILLSINKDLEDLDKIAQKSDYIKITNDNNVFKIAKECAPMVDSYFNGCETRVDLNKRFRALAKVFHPDSDAGNKELYMKIREEYERRVKECSSRD